MTTNAHRPRPDRDHDAQGGITTEQYWLANSCVTIERGPAGATIRIDRFGEQYEREYGGPIDNATLAALSEVSWYGD